MNTATLTDRIVKVYIDGDVSALPGLYAADAIADCNLPQWRYQLMGTEEINRVIREDELGVPDRRVPFWRSGTTNDGFYLEIEVRFTHHGQEQMWRTLHLFRINQGQISHHTLYCSGIWTPADIARYTQTTPAHA